MRPDNTLQRADAQGFSLQVRCMDVEDAEGLESESASEDRTCGNNDIKERDGGEPRKDDADTFHIKNNLSHAQCA